MSNPDPGVNGGLQTFPDHGRLLAQTWLEGSECGAGGWKIRVRLALEQVRLMDGEKMAITEGLVDALRKGLCPEGPRESFSSRGMMPDLLMARFGDPDEYSVEWCSDEALINLLRRDNQLDSFIGMWHLRSMHLTLLSALSSSDISATGKITDDDLATSSKSPVIAMSNEEAAQRLKDAFAQKYYGPGAQRLGDELHRYMEMYDGECHYGKTIAVIQSSGTGKSRAVAELARSHWGVTVCFRDLGSTKEQNPHDGYPFGDLPVCQFLHTPPILSGSRPAPFKGEEIAAAFLGALFFVMHKTIEEAIRKAAQDPNHEAKEFFDDFWAVPDITQFKSSPRTKRFCAVRDKATDLLVSKSQEVLDARDSMPTPTTTPKKTSPQVPQGTDSAQTAAHSFGIRFDQMDMDSAPDPTTPAVSGTNPIVGPTDPAQTKKPVGIEAWVTKLYSIFIAPAADALEKDRRILNLPYFTLIFDECSLLNFWLISTKITPHEGHRGTPFNHITLIALQRMIKTCDSFDFWFFMLDTTSGLHDVYPAADTETARSWRLRSEYRPLPLWSYLPWDVMEPPPKDLPKTPLKALCLSHLKLYGRPLWSTYPDHELMLTAARKLLQVHPKSFLERQGYTGDTPWDDMINLQVLALHSTRFILNLRAEGAAKTLALASVKSHLRILTHYDAETRMVATEVPSEPILAIAAGKLLLDDKKKYRKAMGILVRELLQSNKIISQGDNGEMLARIVLIVNRDATVYNSGGQVCIADIRDDNTQEITTLKYNGTLLPGSLHYAVRPFTLASYLQNLVHMDTIIHDSPETFESGMVWAANVWMNFTHFVQLDNFVESYLSYEFVLRCWNRGCALQCVHDQAIIDMLLIGYCGDLYKPFNPSKFVFVVVQVKNRIDAADLKLINTMTCPFLENGPTRWKPEYMAILMDLGTSTHFWGSQNGPDSAQVRITQGTAVKGKAWSSFEAGQEYNALRFNIRGLDPYHSLAKWAPDILQLQRSTKLSTWSDELTSTTRVMKDMLTLSLKEMEDRHKQRSQHQIHEALEDDIMMESDEEIK